MELLVLWQRCAVLVNKVQASIASHGSRVDEFLDFCADTHISTTMISSEQILERAAQDGSIDMHVNSYSVYTLKTDG